MGASEVLTDPSSLYDVGNGEYSDTYTMLTVRNALASVQNVSVVAFSPLLMCLIDAILCLCFLTIEFIPFGYTRENQTVTKSLFNLCRSSKELTMLCGQILWYVSLFFCKINFFF